MSTHKRMVRVAIVTNIPAPYRLPVFELLAADPGIELTVIYCSDREPDREWDLRTVHFHQVHLRERFVSYRGRFIHINPDVISVLRTARPEVVITTGFNPTHLLAYAYARLCRARHIAMTDGTYASETSLTPIHRWVRRRVFAGTQAYIGASDGAFRLYQSYGIDRRYVFKSHLCANNSAFLAAAPVQKRFDFIFCGRFVAIKNPLFAIDVARSVSRQLGRRVSIVFVGSGELEPEMRAAAASASEEIEATFIGFARQEELPQHYGSARILLFPTQWDPWGVVANEACATGLPVLVTPAAGCADELIRNGENGFVLPLDLAQWTEASVRVLCNRNLYESMSLRGRALVREYSFENAAAGMANAVRMSITNGSGRSAHPERDDGLHRMKVVIIQRRMTHYRVPLFEMMREMLGQVGIELVVVYGDATPGEDKKGDAGTLPWGQHVPCTYLMNNRICWQNARALARDADMVIVTQENRLLFNYLLGSVLRPRALALWGHGRNFQAHGSHPLSEYIKRRLIRHADWWFPYTELSARVVVDKGKFPAARVSVLNNSIDMSALDCDLAGVTAADVEQARLDLGIGSGPIGVVIASLDKGKKIDFLIEAAIRIRQAIPGFELIVVGDGPERSFVQSAVARSGGWLHWLGVRKGHDKALALKMASVMLNPGMVGLGILDSFVSRVPMVTADFGNHGPEIAYLENGINGLMTPPDSHAYALAVVELLTDDSRRIALQAGCAHSAEEVSLEKMAQRFCDGIQRCLAVSSSQRTMVMAQ